MDIFFIKDCNLCELINYCPCGHSNGCAACIVLQKPINNK